MSKNKVVFGLKNVHIAFMDLAGTTQPAWEAPIKVPGAVSLTPDPEGDTSIFYADDMAYHVTTSNNGYTADLTMANLLDEILAQMFGWEIDDNGMLVEIADAKPKPFALLGEVSGDVRNRRFVHYNVQANRPTKEKQTKTETIEPDVDVLPVTISPIEINDVLVVKGEMELSETNKTAFDSFFENVYTPTFGTPEV